MLCIRLVISIVAGRGKGNKAGEIGNGREDVGDVLVADIDGALFGLPGLKHGFIDDLAPVFGET